MFPRTSSRKKQQQKDDTVCFAVWFWNNFYVVPSSCFSLQEILYSILVTDRLIWHYDILNHMFHTLWPHHCLCFDSSRPVWRCIRNRGKHPPRALAETICCSFLTCQWGHHADRWLIAYFMFSHNMHMFLVYFVFFTLKASVDMNFHPLYTLEDQQLEHTNHFFFQENYLNQNPNLMIMEAMLVWNKDLC